jgi:hypothetical protein
MTPIDLANDLGLMDTVMYLYKVQQMKPPSRNISKRSEYLDADSNSVTAKSVSSVAYKKNKNDIGGF